MAKSYKAAEESIQKSIDTAADLYRDILNNYRMPEDGYGKSGLNSKSKVSNAIGELQGKISLEANLTRLDDFAEKKLKAIKQEHADLMAKNPPDPKDDAKKERLQEMIDDITDKKAKAKKAGVTGMKSLTGLRAQENQELAKENKLKTNSGTTLNYDAKTGSVSLHKSTIQTALDQAPSVPIVGPFMALGNRIYRGVTDQDKKETSAVLEGIKSTTEEGSTIKMKDFDADLYNGKNKDGSNANLKQASGAFLGQSISYYTGDADRYREKCDDLFGGIVASGRHLDPETVKALGPKGMSQVNTRAQQISDLDGDNPNTLKTPAVKGGMQTTPTPGQQQPNALNIQNLNPNNQNQNNQNTNTNQNTNSFGNN